jgi:hypothetical protein
LKRQKLKKNSCAETVLKDNEEAAGVAAATAAAVEKVNVAEKVEAILAKAPCFQYVILKKKRIDKKNK